MLDMRYFLNASLTHSEEKNVYIHIYIYTCIYTGGERKEGGHGERGVKSEVSMLILNPME